MVSERMQLNKTYATTSYKKQHKLHVWKIQPCLAGQLGKIHCCNNLIVQITSPFQNEDTLHNTNQHKIEL